MPKTRRAEQIERLENALALVSEVDESQRILALRLRDPPDIAEVRRSRSGLRRLFEILVSERNNGSGKEADR